MRSNQKSWALWLGVLLIIAACVFAYITTKSAEADVASANTHLSAQT